MNGPCLKSPFVWFGGKRKVAAEVWAAFGDVDNYVEPFFGSGAVLLGRPHQGVRRRAETVNDKDGFVANFWRALAAAPDEVAAYCDWPVNETDLFARHLWLVNDGRDRLARLEADPEWFDAKVAGWWVWGVNAWIGSGWCSGNGPWKRPHLGDAGQGVRRKRPHLGHAGQGVHRKRPHLGDAGQGVHHEPPVYGYMRQLAARLRDVRVCAGDWSRVVTTGALAYGATVGVFLDPPYLGEVREKDLYAVDDHAVSHQAREWAVANGDNPRYRIALAGYLPEHDHLVPDGWRRHRWTSGAAYQNSSGDVGRNETNRRLECVWFSPHCLQPDRQATLW